MVGYYEFVRDIDTVIMGWNTYHQIVTELSPDEWIYKDMLSIVMTHRDILPGENIRFVNGDICELVLSLKNSEGGGIWICGGAGVIGPLVRSNLIDRYHISVIPVILGDGIRLFEPGSDRNSIKTA